MIGSGESEGESGGEGVIYETYLTAASFLRWGNRGPKIFPSKQGTASGGGAAVDGGDGGGDGRRGEKSIRELSF